jgi:hypothetical protein
MVSGKKAAEDFIEFAGAGGKEFVIRVSAADYFGNTTSKDVRIWAE